MQRDVGVLLRAQLKPDGLADLMQSDDHRNLFVFHFHFHRVIAQLAVFNHRKFSGHCQRRGAQQKLFCAFIFSLRI